MQEGAFTGDRKGRCRSGGKTQDPKKNPQQKIEVKMSIRATQHQHLRRWKKSLGKGDLGMPKTRGGRNGIGCGA